jgi:hypothetical protein
MDSKSAYNERHLNYFTEISLLSYWIHRALKRSLRQAVENMVIIRIFQILMAASSKVTQLYNIPEDSNLHGSDTSGSIKAINFLTS